MNPFLHDTVAQPLRPAGSWQFPFLRHSRVGLGRRAGMVAMAAATGLGSSFPAQALDVNKASLAELQAVHGVGPRTAQIILQERARAGHFESMEDLSDRVRGIGLKRLQSMQAAGLGVSGAQTGTPAGRPTGKGRAPRVIHTSRSGSSVSPVLTEINQALTERVLEPGPQ